MSDKVALVRLRARNDQYDAAMKESAKHTRGLAGAGDDVAKSSGQMAAGLRLAAAAGAAVIAKQSIQAASDLAESQSKVGVVFGESADAVNRFAADSATAFGQSKAQALEAAGTFGNLFRSIGLTEEQSAKFSTTLTGLASDLASFNNTSVDEALTALRSGLVGETEPLKRFGVNMNEAALKAEALKLGLSDGKGVLDANAKAQAAYALIMEQTTLAQGDFARTADGVANKQRIASAQFEDAKAKLGQGLLPAMSALLGVGSDVIGVFNAMPGPLQMTVLAAAALAIAGPKVAAAWDAVAVSMRNAGGSLTSTVSSVGLLKSAGLGLVAGVGAYNLTYQALERLTSVTVDTENLAGAIEHLGKTGRGLSDVFSAIDGSTGQEIADAFRLAAEGYKSIDAISAKAEVVPGLVARFLGQDYETDIEKLDKAKQSVAGIDEELANLAKSDPVAAGEAFKRLAGYLNDQGIGFDNILPLLPQYNDAIGTAAAKEQVAAAKTDEHNKKIQEQTDAYQANVDAARQRYELLMAAVDADQAVNDAVIGVAEANDAVTEAERNREDAAAAVAEAEAAAAQRVVDAKEKQADAQRSVTDAVEAERDAQEAYDDAVADVVTATEELADAKQRATGDSDDMRDALEAVADAHDAETEAANTTAEAVAALDQVTKDYADTLSQFEDDAGSAADNVTKAEINLREAQDELANFGADAAEKRADALASLADAQQRLNEADTESERRSARRAVDAAQRRVNEATAPTADDRAKAEIAVREAERRLREAERKAAEAKEDLARNKDNGVKGSDDYIAATDAVTDAKDAEADAHRNLEEAVQNVADTQAKADADVAAAEANLADKVDAVNKAQRARIDAHEAVVDAQRAVQAAANDVAAAEAEVRNRTGEVADAEKRLTDAKQAVVDARQAVADAERKVTDALIDRAEAHRDVARDADKGVKPQRDFAIAAQAILDKMDPSDTRFKGLQIYVEMMKTLAGLGALSGIGDRVSTVLGGGEVRSGLGTRPADSDISGKKLPPVIQGVGDPGYVYRPPVSVQTPWWGNPGPQWSPHAVDMRDQLKYTNVGLTPDTSLHGGGGDFISAAKAIADELAKRPTIGEVKVDAGGLTVGQAVTVVDTAVTNAAYAIGVR